MGTVYAAAPAACPMKLLIVCFSCESHFIGYGHYVHKQQAEIHGAQVVLQGFEYADLQDARFLDDHRNRIALGLANFAVLDGGFRHLFRPKISRHPQSMNKFLKQFRKMPCALLHAEWHTGQFVLPLNSVSQLLIVARASRSNMEATRSPGFVIFRYPAFLQLLTNQCQKRRDSQRFHEDFVRLQ